MREELIFILAIMFPMLSIIIPMAYYLIVIMAAVVEKLSLISQLSNSAPQISKEMIDFLAVTAAIIISFGVNLPFYIIDILHIQTK